jgi:hypothetical protein
LEAKDKTSILAIMERKTPGKRLIYIENTPAILHGAVS